MVLQFFNNIKESLSKTRSELIQSLDKILPFGATITDDVLEDVEEVLYEADLGVYITEKLIEELRENADEIKKGVTDPYTVMKQAIYRDINRFGDKNRINIRDTKPYVILVIGVNGVGKTTTIGKLAMRFKNEGKTVLLAACDTFRAAAIEQLEILLTSS